MIAESIMAETHPDYIKGEDGTRSPENGYNGNVLIHRCYGAVRIDGTDYRVKITLKEDGSHKNAPHKAYTYEVTKIEVLDGQTTKPLSVSSRNSNTPNGSTDGEGVPSTSYTGAKLLKDVEKSYDTGKNLLEQSKLADKDTAMYLDGDEDIDEEVTVPELNAEEREAEEQSVQSSIVGGRAFVAEKLLEASQRNGNDFGAMDTAMRSISSEVRDLVLNIKDIMRN